MGLLLIHVGNVISSDIVDGVEEFKAGYEPEQMITLQANGEQILMRKSLLEKFDLLKVLSELPLVFGAVDLTEALKSGFGNMTDFKNMLDILQNGKNPLEYDIRDLIKIVIIADFLGIKDWELLKPIFERIERDVLPHQLARLDSLSSMNPFKQLVKTKNTTDIIDFKDVSSIKWAPNSKEYFVIFTDDKAYRYDRNGRVVGEPLMSVLIINWAQDGQSYTVAYHNGNGQSYNLAGQAIGAKLTNVLDSAAMRSISNNFTYSEDGFKRYPAPNGKSYFMFTPTNEAQLYNAYDDLMGVSLENVRTIYWAPDSQSYFIVFRDATAKLYYLNNFNELNFEQRLIIQAVLNQCEITNEPVDLDFDLRRKLPDEVLARLDEYGCLNL